jgi:hypothetical protein
LDLRIRGLAPPEVLILQLNRELHPEELQEGIHHQHSNHQHLPPPRI